MIINLSITSPALKLLLLPQLFLRKSFVLGFTNHLQNSSQGILSLLFVSRLTSGVKSSRSYFHRSCKEALPIEIGATFRKISRTTYDRCQSDSRASVDRRRRVNSEEREWKYLAKLQTGIIRSQISLVFRLRMVE